jgi:hypothetical protein
VVLAVLLVTACGEENPTLEQENPNYDRYLSDGRRIEEDVATTTLPDGRMVQELDVAVPHDVPGGEDTLPVEEVGLVQDYLPEDVGCVPGTKCYENEWKIMGSSVIIVVDEQAYNPDWYLFDLLPPASKTITFSIKSSGFNQLNLVDAFLAQGGNPAISMEWTTAGLPESLPMVIQKGDSVTGKFHYQPNAGTPATPSVFTVWSSDPDHLERTVLLKPKEQGPDIELPVSAVNFGCGSYCFGQNFTIENAGNQDLVIQSTSFLKQSGEWSETQVPGSGTVLPPKGTPGYVPIPITLDYCDADGNYSDDSNAFQIFSNDPDENPAKIYLNVQLPDICP